MNWKQAILFMCMVVWLATLLLSQNLDTNTIYKAPKPYRQNSLGRPITSDGNEQEDEIYQPQEVNTVAEASISGKNLTGLKRILFFTPYFHMIDWQFGFGHEAFVTHNCPVSNCYATNNRTTFGSMSEFDAILFHMRDMQNIPLPNQKLRKPNQRYVMFLMESPSNDNFPYERFGGFFNWTMTFRRDSDVHRPYGWVAPLNWPFHYAPTKGIDWSNYTTDGKHQIASSTALATNVTKTKKVAWLVSNCHTHSQREHFVQELSKFIQVDIFGQCGQHKCPEDMDCMEYIQSQYLFYLSFENSMCQDYVTEKFWTPLKGNILPIVLGGADYKALAPPKSFINANEFESPEKLAQLLNSLVSNQSAYNEYFEWKRYFEVYSTTDENLSRAMCQLCEKLNNPDEPVKKYDNILEWWRSEAHCGTKGSYPWSKPEIPDSPWSGLSSWLTQGASSILDTLRESKVIV